MSFTFIKALGGKIGSSIHEDSMTEKALVFLSLQKKKTQKFIPVVLFVQKNLKKEQNQKYLQLTLFPMNMKV